MYDDVVLMVDFNIDVNLTRRKHDKLEEFGNLFDFVKLLKLDTCFTKTYSSKIELILTKNLNFC